MKRLEELEELDVNVTDGTNLIFPGEGVNCYFVRRKEGRDVGGSLYRGYDILPILLARTE